MQSCGGFRGWGGKTDTLLSLPYGHDVSTGPQCARIRMTRVGRARLGFGAKCRYKMKGARRSERPSVTGRYDRYLLVWDVPVFSSTAAWAAARRAVSRRKGEQET